MNYADRIVEEARKYLHIIELGNNDGWNDREFQKAMASIGWRRKQAWCAYVCKLIWLNVYRDTEWELPIRSVLTPSVLMTWRNAKLSPTLKKSTTPVRGAIGCFRSATGQGGHMVIFEDPTNQLDIWRTLEGNTNVRGGREGDRFMEKRRNIGHAPRKENGMQYLGSILPPPYDHTPVSLVVGTE